MKIMKIIKIETGMSDVQGDNSNQILPDSMGFQVNIHKGEGTEGGLRKMCLSGSSPHPKHTSYIA